MRRFGNVLGGELEVDAEHDLGRALFAGVDVGGEQPVAALPGTLREVVGDGVDLLVDCACSSAAMQRDARRPR
ncbi:MAG: hypothetical protein M3454_10915 [Actinomycetota bacterium]|nr:hypothetical protein [Actinomycetota bacterium]